MPFHDLHVPYNTNHASLSHTLAFHAELGYSVVAIALLVAGKLPATPQDIPISSLTIPKSLTTVLTRLTLTISDATQSHRLTQFSPAYNILALRPTTEKVFQLCCTSLECDLISLDLSQRLTYNIKLKTVSSALQRGIRFEICYSPAIQASGNSEARRNLISAATQLIRATRGRGIILSSEAKNALGVRGPHDVINLAQIWGLGQERGKEALCEEAEKVLRLAGMKRTSFRGVVDIISGGGEMPEKVKEPNNGQVKEAASNGVKRKASSTSLATSTPQKDQDITAEDKPLSKRQMKKRAKLAKVEAGGSSNGDGSKAGPDGAGAEITACVEDTSASEFPIQHETLYKSTQQQ